MIHSLQHIDHLCSLDSVEELQSGQSLPVVPRWTIQLRCQCLLQYLYSTYDKVDDHFDVRTDAQSLRIRGPRIDISQVYGECSGHCHSIYSCRNDIYHNYHNFDGNSHRGNDDHCHWRNNHGDRGNGYNHSTYHRDGSHHHLGPNNHSHRYNHCHGHYRCADNRGRRGRCIQKAGTGA